MDASTTRAARGRPRSERARAAVLEAAADLLAAGGGDAATMEAIAARARVSKATVYKWWPSRAHVMLESLRERTGPLPAADGRASLADALTAQVAAVTALLRDTAAGPLLTELVAAGQADPAVRAALDDQWLRPRRQAVAHLLLAAVARGELDPGTDVAAAVDQLLAPVYHRLMLGHEPLEETLAATSVGQLLGGLRAPRTRPV